MQCGLEAAHRYGYTRDEIAATCGLALIDAWNGHLGRAKRLADQALKAAKALDGRYEARVYARRVLADIALKQGDLQAAKANCREGLEECVLAERPAIVGLTRLLGQAQEASRAGSGLGTLREGLAAARSMGMLLEEARILSTLSRSDPDEDGSSWDRARELFETCGAERELAVLVS